MVIFHSYVKLPEGIWDNPSHWLSYFWRWLKPPTRRWILRITCSGYCMWRVFLACAEKNLPAFPTCLAQGPNFPPLLTHIQSGSPKRSKGPFSLPGCHNPASYVWACLGQPGALQVQPEKFHVRQTLEAGAAPLESLWALARWTMMAQSW